MVFLLFKQRRGVDLKSEVVGGLMIQRQRIFGDYMIHHTRMVVLKWIFM